ncbi:MAG: hypothetical protein ACODAB_05295 [Gemmatimonadota bacterium]
MSFASPRLGTFTPLLLTLLIVSLPLACQDAERPVPSDEARETVGARGVEADPETDPEGVPEADADAESDTPAEADVRDPTDHAGDDPLARLHEGPARDDLDRFKGRYRDPADHEARPHRVFWIAETCLGSGYLMAGAEWGDVAPWIFRSESDTVFEQSNAGSHGTALRLTFRAPADGQATGLSISAPFDADLERIGDLAEGQEREGEDCVIQLM